MNTLTRLSLRRPRLVIGFWLIVLAFSGALALHLQDAMKAGGFNNPRGSAVLGQSTLERAFGEAPNSLQVVLHDADRPVAPIAPTGWRRPTAMPSATSTRERCA